MSTSSIPSSPCWKTLWLCAVCFLAAAPAHSAVTVVNFGGDYGATNKPFTSTVSNQTGEFGGNSGGHDTRSVVPYSTVTPQIVAGGISGTIYGGYESVNYNADAGPTYPGYAARQITDLGANDAVQISTGARANGSGGRFDGLLLRQKPDFLSGTSGMALSLDVDSKITLRRAAGSGTIYRYSVLVRDGTTVYVNQSSFNNASGTSVQFLLTGQSWAVYDPAVNLEFNGPTNSATFGPHVFTDITGVGFLWDANSTLNGGTFPLPSDIQITAFSADLAVVPEGGSAGLIALGGVVISLVRRRV